MNILYYFLPCILILGIATSFTDIKYGKIKNKWILFGLFYGLIINIALILYYLYQKNLSFGYVSELFVNMFFGLFVGFGFWLLKIWTAGDGKLFFAYSILVPLSFYQHGYIKWIPSAILLINIFVPLFLCFASISLFKSRWNIKKKILNAVFGKRFLNLFVSLFVMHWLVNSFASLIKLNGLFLKAAMLVFIFYIIGKKKDLRNKQKKIMLIILFFCIMRFLFDKSVFTLYFWKEFMFLFVFLSLFKVITALGVETFSKEISVNHLKPGMLLAEMIIKKGKKYEKKIKQELFSLEKSFIEEEAEGITEADIKKIKKTDIKSIKIKQTIPFAPFIFLGVLLTLIAKGNILILVGFLF